MIAVDITVEEAMKLIVSGGLYTPNVAVWCRVAGRRKNLDPIQATRCRRAGRLIAAPPTTPADYVW